ncbi:MAG: Trk system potassium transporter TrkA [Alphaproteobacteria bacterium]|nr:Trk system potassium transporter TrkA [Alphaproteobacteria bacterium]
MKAVVCGAGQVGFAIAKQLAEEQVDVTVIDREAELVQRIADQLDVRATCGHASHPDVLERAGIGEADMLVAVTHTDEVNMIACEIAHALFKVPIKIARVRAQSYLQGEWAELFSNKALPIDVIISPEIEVARAAMRRLDVPGAFDMIPFADDRIRVVGLRIGAGCPVKDTPLRQLSELFPDLHITVMGIFRGERVIAPDGEDQMLVGDEIYFAAEKEHVPRAMTAFGVEQRATRRVVVLGGGNIGRFLARQIEAEHPEVVAKLIEADKRRADAIAETLSRTVVLHGDALDREVLIEANAHHAEACIAVTNDDGVNILASLLAKREGCQRAIALVNGQSYGPMVGGLGLDAVISPRGITVSTILQHIRRGRVRKLQALRDGAAEVVEVEALTTSPLVGKPLREVDLPDGIVLGALLRGKQVVVTRADTVVEAGDRIVLFATSEAKRQVDKLFAVRLEFF